MEWRVSTVVVLALIYSQQLVDSLTFMTQVFHLTQKGCAPARVSGYNRGYIRVVHFDIIPWQVAAVVTG